MVSRDFKEDRGSLVLTSNKYTSFTSQHFAKDKLNKPLGIKASGSLAGFNVYLKADGVHFDM